MDIQAPNSEPKGQLPQEALVGCLVPLSRGHVGLWQLELGEVLAEDAVPVLEVLVPGRQWLTHSWSPTGHASQMRTPLSSPLKDPRSILKMAPPSFAFMVADASP